MISNELLSNFNILSYLDPGTGSIVLQILMGVFFAALFTIKKWGGFILKIFKSRFRPESHNKEREMDQDQVPDD